MWVWSWICFAGRRVRALAIFGRDLHEAGRSACGQERRLRGRRDLPAACGLAPGDGCPGPVNNAVGAAVGEVAGFCKRFALFFFIWPSVVKNGYAKLVRIDPARLSLDQCFG